MTGDNWRRLGLAVGATMKLYEDTFGTEKLQQALGGIEPGSEKDPTIQEIRRTAIDPYTGRVRESVAEEAVYAYRIGIESGKKFNFHNQQ